jgi:hypothetical protein
MYFLLVVISWLLTPIVASQYWLSVLNEPVDSEAPHDWYEKAVLCWNNFFARLEVSLNKNVYA